MADLIVIENESPILDCVVAQRIYDFEKQLQLIKEQEEMIKDAILDEMQRKNIYKVETDDLSITFIAASNRESFDSKAFRKEYPLVYDDFVKISPVKPSVRIRVKT